MSEDSPTPDIPQNPAPKPRRSAMRRAFLRSPLRIRQLYRSVRVRLVDWAAWLRAAVSSTWNEKTKPLSANKRIWLIWASGCTATAFGVAVQVNEYAVAIIFLLAALACCLIQIIVWTGNATSRLRNILAKVFLALASIGLIGVGILDVVIIKGDKPWSNLEKLRTKQPQPKPENTPEVQTTPSPPSQPSPSPQPTPIMTTQVPTPAPSPSPVAPKSSGKRARGPQRKKMPCTWEDTLQGKC